MNVQTAASPQLKLYDQLLQFPLFQGLSRAELLQMAGNTKFGFLKLQAGKTVVREGQTASAFHFLISGSIVVTTQSDDHGYAFTEHLSAPWLLQPEVLFGLMPRFTCTVVTDSEAHFIMLTKDEVLRLLDDFLIIRLNLLNLLATKNQRSRHQVWRQPPQTLRDRIVRFLLDHSVYPAGPKEVRILMTRLAAELGDSRLNVSKVLNAMQADGLLTLYRGRMVIPSLERLFF